MWPYEDEEGRYKLVTKPEVLHAESNAISKLAKSSNSGEDADLFITHSPCLDCAKLIYQSGIKRVYYRENYRNDQGIQFLMRSGVKVSQISDD
jgi:dCMP deaminase